jgi:hypothetical protein
LPALGAPTHPAGARRFRLLSDNVKRGGLWGFIDRTGRMIVQPQFLNVAPDWPDEVEDFQNYKWVTGELVIRN